MSIFCRHDWVKFREPQIAYMGAAWFKDGWWFHFNYNRVFRAVARSEAPPGRICDWTCSKCHKMKLNIDRLIAIQEAERQEWLVKSAKADEIKKRRNAARKFALKYISMKDKV
jgi:hypothetical protein